MQFCLLGMKRKNISTVTHVLAVTLIIVLLYQLVIFTKRERIQRLTCPPGKRNNIIPRERALRVKQFCNSTANGKLPEWSALHNSELINRATNVRFEIGERKFQLCTVLKGGSLSWKAFFKINKIRSKYLKDCAQRSKCWKESNQLSLIQARHPFIRLLSAWRHIFQAEGWRNLEVRFINNSNLLRQGLKQISKKLWNFFIKSDVESHFYQNISWTTFIEDYVLGDTLRGLDMEDYDAPWVWIRWNNSGIVLISKSNFPHCRHHWAPVWVTCGLCQQVPDYVLKVNIM